MRYANRSRRNSRTRALRLEQLERREVLDATPTGVEFLVHEPGADVVETSPSIARNAAGQSLVVWRVLQQIHGRAIDADGEFVSASFQIDNEDDDGDVTALIPQVVMNQQGNAFVVWQESRFDDRTRSSEQVVVGRRFDSLGTPLSPPIDLIIDDPETTEVDEAGMMPRVAMDENGNFAIAYVAVDGLFVQRFGAGGQAMGGRIAVGPDFQLVNDDDDYDIAMAADGDFAVVWSQFDVSTSESLLAFRRYDSSGVSQGPGHVVGTNVGRALLNPAIAMANDGTFAISWTGHDSDDFGVFAQVFQPDGTEVDELFQVNTTTRRTQWQSDIAIDPDGVRVSVVWTGFFLQTDPRPGEHLKVFLQQYALERDFESPHQALAVGPVGGELLVNPSDQAGRGGIGSFIPEVSGALCGDLAVAWQVSAPGDDIFARLYGVTKSGNDPFTQDTDGDALPDCWEMHGYTVPVEGVDQFIDLPAMGANPLRKDIFMELDYMAGDPASGLLTQRPKPAAMQIVRETFANAPVSNPDGSTGITLHIDHGGASPMSPGPDGVWHTDDDPLWISLGSDSEEVPFAPRLGEDTQAGYIWDEFDALKHGPDGVAGTLDDRLLPGRAKSFHYGIFAHQIDDDESSGIARNGDDEAFFEGSSNFIVSLGTWNGGNGGTVLEEAAVLTHEHGHGLGLAHGGDDHINYKPNYLSVMNYSFILEGLYKNNGSNFWDPGRVDFSRFKLDDLSEDSLDEEIGLSGPGFHVNDYGTVYHTGGGRHVHDRPASLIDWNLDGDERGKDEDADINDDGKLTVLKSHHDWDNLRFSGGGIGGFGPPPDLPMSTHLDEPTFEMVAAQPRDFRPLVASPGTVSGTAAEEVQLTFHVENLGDVDDTFDLAVSSLRQWLSTDGVPAEIQVAAGERVPVTVTIEVPAGAELDELEEVTLKATSQGNPRLLDTGLAIVEILPSALPTVAITSPDDASEVVEGSTVVAEVEATDDVGIQRVDLTLNGAIVGSDSTPPYEIEFTAPAEGNPAVLTAIAVDTDGQTKASAAVSLEVVTNPFPWHNVANPLDVNGRGGFTVQDVALVVADLLVNFPRQLPEPDESSSPPPFLDVIPNNQLTVADVAFLVSQIVLESQDDGLGEGVETDGDQNESHLPNLLPATDGQAEVDRRKRKTKGPRV